MPMKPGLRKLALTIHITSSVGWLGSVAGFLTLAIMGLFSREGITVQATYLGMDWLTTYIILPFSIAALLSGIVQSLGTSWGLFRHYWVVVKLLLTILATSVLILHTQPIRSLGREAAAKPFSATDFRETRIQLVADAVAGIFVLLTATALAVYKPRGLTRYGWRRQREQRKESAPEKSSI